MRRVAEGIAAGRSTSDLATVNSVTLTETYKPRRIATRRGLGFRGGFLYPLGDSYGDANRLTGLHLVYKYEGPKFLVQSTSLLGLNWNGDTVEWNLLDVFAARIFGIGDVSSYFGGGLGIKSLRVERTLPPSGTVTFPQTVSQSATTLSADVGVGILVLRTYDFHLVLEFRYHHIFEDFEEIGGGGANGFMLTFGTSR